MFDPKNTDFEKIDLIPFSRFFGYISGPNKDIRQLFV